MCKRLLLAIFAMGSVGLVATEAPAQFPPTRGIPSYNVPTYSPYLNLNRRGGTLSQNYFGLVRPEIDFRQNLQQLNRQVTYNEQAIADIGNQPLPATGHTIFFNNTSHFFGNLTGAGGGRGASAAAQVNAKAPQAPQAGPAPADLVQVAQRRRERGGRDTKSLGVGSPTIQTMEPFDLTRSIRWSTME